MIVVLSVTMAFVVATIGAGVYVIRQEVENKKVKRFLGLNVVSFFGLMVGVTIFLLSGVPVNAADTAQVVNNSDGLKYIGAALSTGLAAIGTGIAVGPAASAAIGAISEDPSLLGKTVIFVGLAEGIAIYGLIISIMILG